MLFQNSIIRCSCKKNVFLFFKEYCWRFLSVLNWEDYFAIFQSNLITSSTIYVSVASFRPCQNMGARVLVVIHGRKKNVIVAPDQYDCGKTNICSTTLEAY